MSDAKKVALNEIEWSRVRMLSIQGNTVHFVTDEGPLDFDFATEQEPKDALEHYFGRQGKPSN